MTLKNNFSRKIISVVLALIIMLSCMPLGAIVVSAADDSFFAKTVDPNTMDLWKDYFVLDDNRLDTSNAGGVWTDKSVFSDDSVFDGTGITLTDDKNFLTALSAISANKEVVGYSTIPTDTVFILDLSGSMDGNEQALINATNDAIKELYKTNNNNRVGVVLYSASGTTGSSTYAQSVTRILPIDRYTPGNSGNFLRLDGNTVKVAQGVRGTNSSVNLFANSNQKSFNGGTYIQAGLWEAMKAFTDIEKSDTVIGDNNWQTGENRMPIVVLMSDGAPTTGTSFFDDVENSHYVTGQGRNQQTVYASNVGNGSDSNMTVGQGFLTQLTASYIINRIENHYAPENQAGKSLFYTLGFNISNNTNSIAYSVLNPDAATITDSLWESYNSLTSGTMNVNVKGRNGSNTDVAISKNSYAQSKSYVDEYFPAANGGLQTAFKSIVDEIILQSRYYPTHLQGGNPDFSGYVEFTDTLGEYMEVKSIKGILLGDTLFDGHMMASKFTDTSENGLGTVDNPSALGDEFIRSVKQRLNITNTADAQALVKKAWDDGQLYYNQATGEWSNYIAWYAKDDYTYLGFWDKDDKTVEYDNAVYKIKSYGFLGATTGSIKNSDMMYMTVQVRTNIKTGEQTVIWKIPASLVPMITYLVTLTGTNVDTATDVEIKVEDKNNISPIRLIFESGLRSDLNEFNITRITESAHIADDGFTRQFWSNYFDISGNSHDQHKTTLAEFTPSKENERFYYTFDSVIYKNNNGNYEKVEQGELNANGTYYHRRYVFKSSSSTPIFTYETLSKESIGIALEKGWQSSFKVSDTDTGAYIVPKGTVARELTPYDKQKADLGQATKSAKMIFHPYVTNQNELAYVDMNLGNNGLLQVTPAQGIKVSKTVDVFEDGTQNTFKFRITLSHSGTFDTYITALNEIPSGQPTKTVFQNGVYEVELAKDQTVWIAGLPTGTTYTVEEISYNPDYKIKTVHVNGQSQGTVAQGTVAAYFIDNVHFVNTAIGEGDLVITKNVYDQSGNPVDVTDSVLFTAEVTLTNAAGAPVSGRFEATNAQGYVDVDSNGKFSVTLHDNQSFILRALPEQTRYTVTETAIPAGFEFNPVLSSLNGVIDATGNDQALIANTYIPVKTDGDGINVIVYKTISGNRDYFMSFDSFSFKVERIGGSVIADQTVDYNSTVKNFTVSLENEIYEQKGSYYYKITETLGSQGGFTYDTAERRFRVDVDDTDLDGDLEIIAVVNESNTAVTGQYTVEASFNNIYAATGSATAVINVEKTIKDDNYHKNGFVFALYNSSDILNADEIIRSAPTTADGKTKIELTYAANRASMDGEKYTYYLAEVNTGNPNIKYDQTVYKVVVTVTDNGDGTVSATPVITALEDTAAVNAVFENEYIPSSSDFVTISGTKNISGDRAINANEFEFVLTPANQNNPMPAQSTVKNAADGSFAFGAIEFNAVGTYTYTLAESQQNKIGGFDYDDSEYTITVNVVDNGNATLTATTVINNGAVEDIVFTNTYAPTPIDVTISGHKQLTGKTLQNNEFTFKISAVSAGAPMPSLDTAKNAANGTFNFDKITYTKAGSYIYTVTELATNDARYDFDKSVYTVTVTVRDNSEGILSHSISYSKNNMPGTAIVFVNGFVPTPIEYDISAKFGGKKILDGRELKENEFEFVLINAINGEQIGGSIKNLADGTFAFAPVTLPEAGIYHYKVAEVEGDQKGIWYDTDVYHVVLEVKKRDSGELYIVDDSEKLYIATVTKQEIAGVLTEVTEYTLVDGKIKFNNSYRADPTDIVIVATKKLVGRDLTENEFTFNLYDSVKQADGTYTKGDLISSAKNLADGTVTFGAVTIKEAGEYCFFVTEDSSAQAENITYDKNEYKVLVTVTDDKLGSLNAEFKFSSSDGEADSISFVNTYTKPTPPPTPPAPTPAPETESPKTGDTQNLNLWAMLSAISALAVLAFGFGKKGKKEN